MPQFFAVTKTAVLFRCMKGSNILLAAGGLLLYSLFSKGTALSRLTFYPKGVTGLKFDGVTPVLSLALIVQNTSNQNIVLRSFAGDVWANDYYIGNVSTFNPIAIAPNSEVLLNLNLRLSLIGIATDIVNSFLKRSAAQELVLDATANADKYQLPVKIKYKVG